MVATFHYGTRSATSAVCTITSSTTTAMVSTVYVSRMDGTDSTGAAWVRCSCGRSQACLDVGERVRCPNCREYLSNGYWDSSKSVRVTSPKKPREPKQRGAARSKGPEPRKAQCQEPLPLHTQYRKPVLIPRRHQRHRRWK